MTAQAVSERYLREMTSLRSSAFIGLGTILLTFGGIGLWSAAAPLASAAIAPGIVVVDGNRRSLQHPEGGVVRSIHVRDGDIVEAGQVLVTLEDTRIGIALETLRPLLATNLAQRARLEAERNRQGVLVVPDVEIAGVRVADFLSVVEQQRQLLESRRTAHLAKLLALTTIEEQARATLRAHQQQLEAQLERLRLTQVEMGVAGDLARSGAGTQRRVSEVARTLAEVRVDLARLAAQTAEAQGRSEAAVREADLARAIFLEDIDTEIQRNEREHVDLRERLWATIEQARRLLIRASVSGVVVNRAVHTVGGVVGAGTALLEIVPDGERLVIEAQVRPNDSDRIRPGLPVEIRLSGLDGGLLPRLQGTVLNISADRMIDRLRGTPYFEVRVEATVTAQHVLGHRRLRPGMAVDVMILRGEKTVVEYLGASLLQFFAGSMRE